MQLSILIEHTSIERNISGFVANLPALWFLFRQLETSSSASCPPHDTFNHTSIFSEDIQKPTTLSAVVPTKHRQPDPYDLEADDCIPLRQRTVEHSSLHTLSGGSLGTVDGKMAKQDPRGVPRGWDDPTLEEGYKRESSEDQN